MYIESHRLIIVNIFERFFENNYHYLIMLFHY